MSHIDDMEDGVAADMVMTWMAVMTYKLTWTMTWLLTWNDCHMNDDIAAS